MTRQRTQGLGAAVLWAGAGLSAGMGMAQEVPGKTYVTRARLILTGDVPKTGEAGAAYQTLLDNSAYHAAFAVGPDGAFGWADNYARQMDADVAALNWCGDEACRVVAQVAPQDVVEIAGQPLSKSAATGAEMYGGKPGFKALALSNLGDWGMAWGEESRQAAEANALAECRSCLTSDMPEGLPTGRCRTLWVD